MKSGVARLACVLACSVLWIGASTIAAESKAPAQPKQQGVVKADVWVLHLPGIAGTSRIDRSLIQGLRDAGYDGPAEIYDWTGNNPGIPALLNRKGNDLEAQKIADRITARARAHPGGRILLTGHSAGTGLAAFALEKLPPGVKVETVLLLAPALSPTYDLSKALGRVTGKAYAFTSPNDAFVLGAGTTLLGTIDGKKVEAAGKAGFTRPDDAADPEQYKKLIAKPYDRAWMKLNNIGDHIGVMARPFVAAELAPLLFPELPPRVVPVDAPTTRPAARAQTR
jgi:pimeloyl-ACP methyl ester carboxylesterase